MSFSSSEKDFSAVFRLVSTWRLHRKFIWIGILGKTFLGVFHRQIKVKNRTESCSHINLFPPQILVLISWMVSFIIFDGVCSVGSQRVVYMRENKPRTARINGQPPGHVLFLFQGPVVQRPIFANSGLNFNPGLFFFCPNEFPVLFSPCIFRPSNHQTVDKKNKTDFAF